MTLFKEYVLERQGKNVIEDEQHFVVYHFYDDVAHIDDLHVNKSFRKQGIASKACNVVAALGEGRGCKWLQCNVFSQALNASDSMAAALAYGFKIYRTDDQRIWLRKAI